MRALFASLLLACCLAGPALAAPPELAGVRLGSNIRDLADKLDPGMAEPELEQGYLTIQAMKPLPGYRSGYVTYGNCAQPGRVVRVKMNYADSSREFHDKILAGLKKRYGEPKQWRGNAFGNLRIWKWSLLDPHAGDVSIILQYYDGEDDSFTRGNSLRISSRSWVKEEQDCRRAKQASDTTSKKPEAPARPLDLDYFLPR
ncbi:hypothetical protein [Fundidesulfovibrio magnetotacticus]|uniref:hypothetical protein n=1 Tax=Fundidesulfovibrio magnetotacticus TaxID=2730080 RepID=UPI001567931F|nr:hypothetical protein [Fundidesulfovibrio magnetotacticus]